MKNASNVPICREKTFISGRKSDALSAAKTANSHLVM